MSELVDKLAGTTKNQFLITPASAAGIPSGPHLRGEQHVDSVGNRYFCITSGTPGVWIRLDIGSGFFGNLSFCTTAARNQASATNIWLRGPGNVPMNQAPFRIPFDSFLIFVSATTNTNETCDFEVYRNAPVRAGGTPNDAAKLTELVFAGQNSGDLDLTSTPISLDAGDEIGVYMRGSNVNRPRVNLFFTRRFA